MRGEKGCEMTFFPSSDFKSLYATRSEKSPEKNRNEIGHSLCMPHGSDKS